MKATELIKHLQDLIEKEGDEVEVFMSASGYYCSDRQEDLQVPEQYEYTGVRFDKDTQQNIHCPVTFWSIGHSEQNY